MKEEILPFREKIKKQGDRWYFRKDIRHSLSGISMWDRIDRIIENNVGYSFDSAFSYFCKQVPKYQQQFFYDYFDNSPQNKYHWHKYFLDENGIICKKKSPKRIYKIYSDDYRVYWEDIKHKHKKYTQPYFFERDYIQKYEGTITIVESKKDRRWKKYVREQKQKYKKDKNEWKEISFRIFNEGLRLQKEKELKQKELDL